MYPTSRLRPRADRPYRRSRRRVGCYGTGLAAEDHRPYVAGSDAPAPGDQAASRAVSSGLPILAEVPRLAAMLDRLDAADAALLDAVSALADLLDEGTVEDVTGVGLEHWLAAIGAQTRMDRRLLLRACRLMHRLPTLAAAVREHRISFAQLRGLTIGLRNAKRVLDEGLDQVLGALLDELDRFERPDPDVLVQHMVDALDDLDPDDFADREADAASGRYLDLQPNPDGTGARLFGAFDAVGAALLDAATTPSPEQVEAAGGYGAARADLLLAHLTGATDAADVESTSPEAGEHIGVPPPPQLLLRLPFDALLDDRLPADLLVRLTGGRLRLTSAAARRLLDEAGARLRAIVVDDDGAVLGVGRASRQPPGWLRDVLAAVHDTCTGPCCDRPARGAQVDHATPWWPAPDAPAGATDLDNLGPLCPTTNRAKEAGGWRVQQRRAGTRTWVHPRSGLTMTTVPATWRPPNDPRRRRPPRPDPPGDSALPF